MATWTRQTFRGNPYASITAISTGGGIAVSRSSGETPCFIQCSASAITATGSSRPYEDIEFLWTAEQSDGGGGWEAITDSEGLTDPVTGNSVNPYTDQYGPEAMFPFRTANTYRITLRCRGYNSGSLSVTETVTTTITVTDGSYAVDQYYDALNGSDANNGSTELLAKQTGMAMRSNDAADLRYRLEDTGDYDLDNAVIGARTGRRWIGYGSGNGYAVVATGAAYPVDQLLAYNTPGTNTSTDHVYSLVHFNLDALLRYGVLAAGTGAGFVSHLYWDNCKFYNPQADASGVLFSGAQWHFQTTNSIGFYATDFDGTGIATKHAIFVEGIDNFLAFFACSFVGDGSNATLDHHVYPHDTNNILTRWCDFNAGTNRSYAINHNCTDTVSAFSQYVSVQESDFGGPSRALDFSGTNNNRASNGAWKNVVVEGNAFHDLSATGTILYYNCDTLVIRDNVWFANAKICLQVGDALSAFYFYNNLMHLSASVTAGDAAIAINAANETAFRISDNKIVDLRTQPCILSCNFTNTANAVAAGAVISGNTYYCPNDTSGGAVIYDTGSSTYKTVAQLEAAISASGTFTEQDPGWTDAANGDFSTIAPPPPPPPPPPPSSDGVVIADGAVRLIVDGTTYAIRFEALP